MNVKRLVEWAKQDKHHVFEVRFIAAIAHPWAVRLDHDVQQWSVTADCHSSLEQAIEFALEQAAKEEPNGTT